MTDFRIGIIYPGDGALDREFWSFAPENVSLHFTRQPQAEGPVGLAGMKALVDDGSLEVCATSFKLIAPSVVAFACTSASFIQGLSGEADLRLRIERASGSVATTTSGAILAACRAMGITKVAVLAPYVEEVSIKLGEFLEEADIGVSRVCPMGLVDGIADVSVDDVVRLGIAADTRDSEGLVISCTNLVTIDAIDILEKALGKPVVTANQATIWHACLLARAEWPHDFGVGRLWRKTVNSSK
ncbi:arylmalonate decarboxylase [Gammaproteobacteria bacterium]|nr:arylmalonate decarboxylase [Gammaproteobacteria bacterium]